MLSKEEFDQQYAVIQNKMGWYDRSDTGKIVVMGADRFDWLQGMVSNDVSILKIKSFYGNIKACLLDATGHILSDMSIFRVYEVDGKRLVEALGLPANDFILIDLPRENAANVMALLDRYIIMEDVELRDVTDALGCISIQGKTAYEYWDMASGSNTLFSLFAKHKSNPADHTGYRGFDIYFAPKSLDFVAPLSENFGVPQIDREVIETLRVENGIPKWGAELASTVIASEAVGKSHISLTKGCYVGQEIIARIDARGHTNRALTGMIVMSEILPQVGDKLFAEEDGKLRETGRITSIVPYAPAAEGKPIALGYVRHEHRTVGDKVITQGDNGQATLTVTELPFNRKSAA